MKYCHFYRIINPFVVNCHVSKWIEKILKNAIEIFCQFHIFFVYVIAKYLQLFAVSSRYEFLDFFLFSIRTKRHSFRDSYQIVGLCSIKIAIEFPRYLTHYANRQVINFLANYNQINGKQLCDCIDIFLQTSSS